MIVVDRPPPEPPDLHSVVVGEGEPRSSVIKAEGSSHRLENLETVTVIHSCTEDGAVAKGNVLDVGSTDLTRGSSAVVGVSVEGMSTGSAVEAICLSDAAASHGGCVSVEPQRRERRMEPRCLEVECEGGREVVENNQCGGNINSRREGKTQDTVIAKGAEDEMDGSIDNGVRGSQKLAPGWVTVADPLVVAILMEMVAANVPSEGLRCVHNTQRK
ncbi:hypothetical protein PIB30_001184 [Stylosanthes scabra]|uniref:Uncharacterized protein n=1 Tax=Stylosanthes scabra TaxID=79078 RepID=A0ABU6V100_9FABA|nr:hypothetical protein [Stylosanthes scabra]